MVAQVLPWSLNGGTVVATVIAQWTPLVGQRRHNGGTRKADVSLKLIHKFRIFYWATNGRPLCIHSATTAMCVPSSCLPSATCDRPPRRPLCDCFEHAQNFTATMASMAMSERPMCHPWTTKATVRPPFCLQRRPGQFCGRTREAQRSQPLCKGGISNGMAADEHLARQAEVSTTKACNETSRNIPVSVKKWFVILSSVGGRVNIFVADNNDNRTSMKHRQTNIQCNAHLTSVDIFSVDFHPDDISNPSHENFFEMKAFSLGCDLLPSNL